MCLALGPLLLAHHAEYLWIPCHCRKAALQVSMNDGLSFISSSVIITTTHCVSHHLPFDQKLHYHCHLPGKCSHSVHWALIPALLSQPWAGAGVRCTPEYIRNACVQVAHVCDRGWYVSTLSWPDGKTGQCLCSSEEGEGGLDGVGLGENAQQEIGQHIQKTHLREFFSKGKQEKWGSYWRKI